MSTLLILPTQLFAQSLSFWLKWENVILYEDPYYINNNVLPLKLWFHKSAMLEYFDAIKTKHKIYVSSTSKLHLPSSYSMYHPTDRKMILKYKKASFMETPMFLLRIDELSNMDTSIQNSFYKKMRIKYDILMKGDKPIGGEWSFDKENRNKYPKGYTNNPVLTKHFTNKYIVQSKPSSCEHMLWPTNRKDSIKWLSTFVQSRLHSFGPYQDAIDRNVLLGEHSGLSPMLNIGLVTPIDVLRLVEKQNVPIESKEGFIRQIIGWREFIRMKYILHGNGNWNYLKNMNNSLPRSWYTATTGIDTLDWSISRVLKTGYVPHIERLMLLLNYATLLQLKYSDVKKWFINMFIDGYDWVMLNTLMGVNSLGPNNRFMTRVYLTNGTYLKKMGLTIPKADMDNLKILYDRFIMNNKQLVSKDYRLASIVSRKLNIDKGK
jgi:deoxyribodipyrimidine photolyase-related protein